MDIPTIGEQAEPESSDDSRSDTDSDIIDNSEDSDAEMKVDWGDL